MECYVNREGNACGGCCGSCGGCGEWTPPALTDTERELLRLLAESAFLPVARRDGSFDPVFRETEEPPESAMSEAILSLWQEGLVDLDYTQPLGGFDYAAYPDCPHRGSMAMTALGQLVWDEQ